MMKISGENALAKFLQTFCSTFLQSNVPVKLNTLSIFFFFYYRYQSLVLISILFIELNKGEEDDDDNGEEFFPKGKS